MTKLEMATTWLENKTAMISFQSHKGKYMIVNIGEKKPLVDNVIHLTIEEYQQIAK